ncbi:MAG: hypothetical protein AMXMBFR84_12620 [Candidatus Hydrogenedentota bacterium]
MRCRAYTLVLLVALLFSSLVKAQSQPSGPGTVEGVVYGRDASLPLPRTLVFSVSPDKILANAEAWKAQGVGGFFLEGVASEWSSDVWATDKKPHTIGASDETFQKVREVNALCKRLGMVTYLKIVYANPLEWFNDTAWQHINHHFRQFAIFARAAGCRGVALDIEYVGQQFAFDWEGYTYDGYTRKDLIRTIRERSAGQLRAMYDEFPEMEFLVLPEGGIHLGTHIQTSWIEVAAERDAPGGVHFFMEATYTSSHLDRYLAYTSATNLLFRRQLSERGREYWARRCTLAAGTWPTGFDIGANHDSSLTPTELRQSFAGALMVSPKFNWVYVDRYGEHHVGNVPEDYEGKTDFAMVAEVLGNREIVLDDRYKRIALALRGLPPTDPAADLGIAAVPRFMLPHGTPTIDLVPSTSVGAAETEHAWDIAMAYYEGESQDLQAIFQPIRDWRLIGPFPSGDGLTGHDAVYGPEKEIDLTAAYEGANGSVAWQPFRLADGALGIDFKPMFTPNENAVAYALTYVESPVEQAVQIRFASNDAGKLWVGGKLVNDFNRESWSVLDRDIVEVTLPKGKTPVLCKVTNGIGAWTLVVRITDKDGEPVKGLVFSGE